jgi:hypothetical protein
MKFDKLDWALLIIGIALIFLTPGAPDEAVSLGLLVLKKILLR